MNKYYILSLERIWGDQAVFWGPNNSGYTSDLDRAGIYTQEEVDKRPKYYNNKDTRPIPVEEIDKLAHRCVNRSDTFDLIKK